MKFKVIMVTVLAIMAILVPVGVYAEPWNFWQGTSVVSTIEPLVVSGIENGVALVSPFTMIPVTVNRGDSFTKTLWVKNTGAATHIVHGVFSCNQTNVVCNALPHDPGGVTLTAGQSAQFDFVMTAIGAGVPCTVTLSFTSD